MRSTVYGRGLLRSVLYQSLSVAVPQSRPRAVKAVRDPAVQRARGGARQVAGVAATLVADAPGGHARVVPVSPDHRTHVAHVLGRRIVDAILVCDRNEGEAGTASSIV